MVKQQDFTGRGLVVTAHLGFMATTVAYLLFSKGISTTPASAATTFSLAEPVTALSLRPSSSANG